MIDYYNHGVVWYAMKTTFKRELKAKAYIESCGVECFVPMQKGISQERGRRKVVVRPAIHNLIFVKVDLAQLKELKISLSYLHNYLVEDDGVLRPIVVSATQMDQFIRAITHSLDKVIFVDLAAARLDKGTPVRIIAGEFEGYEGVLNRIKGKRDRRVTVNVEGIVAYMVDVDAAFIEAV